MSQTQKDSPIILTGNSNPKLAESIVKYLKRDLTECVVKQFSNTETCVWIEENVRNCDVVIIQTGSADQERSVNDHLMETWLLADACVRSSAKSITFVIPCYPYARQEKKLKPREPIAARFVANVFSQFRVKKRFVFLDLHAAQIQGFFDEPVDNLYAINEAEKHMNENVFKGMTPEEKRENFIVIAPDQGAHKRTLEYAKRLGLDMLDMDKTRDKPGSVGKTVLRGDEASIQGRTCLIVDDLCDTYGTMEKASDTLVEMGAKDVIALITHAILSGPAIERLNNCKSMTRFITSNSLPQEAHKEACSKIEVYDVGELLGEVIRRLFTNETKDNSISELFNGHSQK